MTPEEIAMSKTMVAAFRRANKAFIELAKAFRECIISAKNYEKVLEALKDKEKSK